MITDSTCFSMGRLCAAMNHAFSDYAVPMQLDLDGFTLMMRSRGLRADLSRLVVEDGKIAAFWLIGARGDRAYLISTGTAPKFRRGGLSRRLGEVVKADLQTQGFKTLQSEVLVNNPAARALYHALGFDEGRSLDCYAGLKAALAEASQGITNCDMTAISSEVRGFWDSVPSWQNDIGSLIAAGRDVTCFAIKDGAGLVAYAAIVPAQSSLAQIAVRPDMRRKGLGTQLLAYGQNALAIDNLRIINIDRADTGLAGFVAKVGGALIVSQKELHLAL